MADLTYKFKKPAVVPDEDEITVDDLLKKSSKSKSKPAPETDVNPQNYIPITDTSEEVDPDEALVDELTPTPKVFLNGGKKFNVHPDEVEEFLATNPEAIPLKNQTKDSDKINKLVAESKSHNETKEQTINNDRKGEEMVGYKQGEGEFNHDQAAQIEQIVKSGAPSSYQWIWSSSFGKWIIDTKMKLTQEGGMFDYFEDENIISNEEQSYLDAQEKYIPEAKTIIAKEKDIKVEELSQDDLAAANEIATKNYREDLRDSSWERNVEESVENLDWTWLMKGGKQLEKEEELEGLTTKLNKETEANLIRFKYHSESVEDIAKRLEEIKNTEYTTQDDWDKARIAHEKLRKEAELHVGNIMTLTNTQNEIGEDNAELTKYLDMVGRNYQWGTNVVAQTAIAVGEMGLNVEEFVYRYTNPNSLILAFDTSLDEGLPEFLQPVVRYAKHKDIMRKVATHQADNLLEQARNGLEKPQELSDIQTWEDFGEWASFTTASQLPNTAVMLTTGPYALPILGATSAGGKFRSMQKEMDLYGTEYSPLQMYTAATITGVAEALSEKITLGQLNAVKKSVGIEKKLKQGFSAWLTRNLMTQKGLGQLIYDPIEEGFTEMVSQWSENMADKYVLGKKDVHWSDGLKESFVSGVWMSGVVYKTPGLGISILNSFQHSDTKGVLGENAERIREINELLAKPLDDKNRSHYEEELTDLINDNNQILAKDIKRLDDMLPDEKKSLIELERKKYVLLNQVDNVRNDKSLDNEQTLDELNKLKDQYQKLQNNKNEILQPYIAAENAGTIDKQVEMLKKRSKGIFGDKLKFEVRDDTDTLYKKLKEDNDKLDSDNPKKKSLKELRQDAEQQGFIAQDPTTGQQTIYINKDVAAKQGAVNVAGHEFLHAVLFEAVKFSPDTQKALGNSLQSYLMEIDSKQIESSKFQKRLKQYQDAVKSDKYKEGDAAEEVMTLFSDALNTGDIKFNENIFTRIGDVIRRVLQSAGVQVKFNDGRDVYNFIKDYNHGVVKGKFGKSVSSVARGDVSGKLIKAKDGVIDVINKESKAEGLSAQVQDLYDKKGKDAAFEITELYRGMANKISGKYRDVPGYTTYKDDFIEQLLVDGRGVYGLVTSYNPKSGVPLAAYINKYLPSRAIEIANSIFQKEFTSDITEQRGVVAEETAVEEVVDDTPSLRKQLNIEENNPLYNKIKNAVIKAFGTKLPVVLSSKFKQALKKAYRTSLKPAIADLIGTRAIKEKFLSDNFEAIYAKLSQETINKRFQQFAEPLLDLNGNQIRENTREGKTVFKKRNITKAEWLAYFIGKNVKPSKRGSRKDALAESLAEELAFDATMEVIKDPAIQNKRKGIDEILEREQAENYIEEAGKQIDRNPNTKFSLSEEGLDFSFNVKERKSLTNLINQIQKKEGDIDKILGEYLGFKNQSPESIQQVQDTARWLHDSGLITNKASHGFIQDIKKLGFKYGKALNAKLTHLDDLKAFSTDMITLSSALGGAIMQIHSGMKDMLGYINRVLDPARRKETVASIEARKAAKDAGKASPKKIYEKNATGAFYHDSLKVLSSKDKKLAKSLPAGLKLEFVEFMNSKTGIMKEIRDIQAMTISRGKKIALFKKVDSETGYSLEQRVELANTHNVLLAKHILSTVTNLYKKDKISESSMLHFFQLQTNAVNGLRALSKLDLIRFSTGKQFGMKTVPEHSENGKYKTKEAAKKAYIDSWKGVNGWNQVYAKIKEGLLDRTPPSKIIKLTIKALSEKGEHLAPNSNTMAGAVEIANNKDLNEKQRADAIEILLKNHVQWLDTNNNLDYVDVIGKTSPLNAKRIRVLSTNARKDIYVVGKTEIDIETYIDDSIKNNEFYDSQKTEATSKETESNSKASLSSKSIDDAMADDIFAFTEAKERKRDPLSKEFNDMIQDTQGIDTNVDVTISDAKQNKKGWKNWRTFFWASADDFMGMMYDFIGENEDGDMHKKWIEDTLLNPYRKAVQKINTDKQETIDWLDGVVKRHKKTNRKLQQRTANGIHTYGQAVRIYLYDKAGHDMTQHGLNEKEITEAIESVRGDANLQAYADELASKGKGKNPYENKPPNYWNIGNIGSDFMGLFEGEGRSEYLKDFIANSEIVFSELNLNKIEKTRGAAYREDLENTLHRMKTGRNRVDRGDRIANGVNDWVNKSVGAIMFVNTRSAFLQLLSTINFMNWTDNKPHHAAKAFANQKQFWADVEKIWKSPKLKQRRDGMEMDINTNELIEIAKGSESKFQAILSHVFQKYGFWPTKIADSFAISMGGASMYRNRINTYLKEGMSKAEAEAKAWQDFSDVSEESQQSSDPSLISEQQAGGMGRLLLAFQNTPMQYFRLIQKAARDLKNGRGDRITNISKIAYYGIAQNAMFVFLQKALWTSIFDNDDDERCAQFKDTPEDLKLINMPVEEYRTLSGEQKKAKKAAETRSKKNAKKFDKCSIVNEESKETLMVNMISNVTKGAGILGGVLMTGWTTWREMVEEEEEKGMQAQTSKVLLNAMSISPVISSKLWKLSKAIDGRKYDNSKISIWASALEGLTNIPADRVVKKIKNLNDAFLEKDVETYNRILLFLGWSSWNLKLDLNDTRSAERKERKAEEAATEVIQRREELKNLGSSRTVKQKNEYIDSLKKTNSQWQKDELYNYGLTENEVKALKIEQYRIGKLIEFYDKKNAPYDSNKAKTIKKAKDLEKEASLAAKKKRIKGLGYKTEKEYREHQDLKKETSTAEQKRILSSFGLTKAQIRYYKREDDRVKKIIALRKKKKK